MWVGGWVARDKRQVDVSGSCPSNLPSLRVNSSNNSPHLLTLEQGIARDVWNVVKVVVRHAELDQLFKGIGVDGQHSAKGSSDAVSSQ